VEGLGAADLRGDQKLVEPVVKLLHVIEGGEQLGGGLAADPGDAGDVVHRIAGEPEEVGDLVWPHAELPLDGRGVVALPLGEIEKRDALGDELREVLVRGDDHSAVASRKEAGAERADQVVRLVARVDEVGGSERRRDLQAGIDLRHQLGRRLLALRLVGGEFVVAEAAVQVAVEGHHEVGGTLVRDELEQEAREAVDRAGPRAVRALERGGQREVSPEDIGAGIDEMDGGRLGHRGGSSRENHWAA
jgi:hypothetical protein